MDGGYWGTDMRECGVDKDMVRTRKGKEMAYIARAG